MSEHIEIKNCPIEVANDIWNEAIEKALQICEVYDRGLPTDAGMIRLRLTLI